MPPNPEQIREDQEFRKSEYYCFQIGLNSGRHDSLLLTTIQLTHRFTTFSKRNFETRKIE